MNSKMNGRINTSGNTISHGSGLNKTSRHDAGSSKQVFLLNDGLRYAVICCLALVGAPAFFACEDDGAGSSNLKDCNGDNVIDLEDLYCQSTPMGDNHPAGKITFVQSDVAGTWWFTASRDYEATYDETGKRISGNTDTFKCPPTSISLKADGAVSGTCSESGSSILTWSKKYTYTGTMSRDKTSMSGSLKLFEVWDNTTSQTTKSDWTAVRTSALESESDVDSGSDGDTDGDPDADENPDADSDICADVPGYVDADGYHCNAWSGYDCTEAVSKWGYTQAEEDELLENCPVTCGLCS